MRDEAGAAAGVAILLRARVTDVRAAQFRRLVEEPRVIRLFVGKRLAAGLAGMGAGLNVPLVHGRGNLTTNGTDEHEEIFKTANLPQRHRGAEEEIKADTNFHPGVSVTRRPTFSSRNRNPSSSCPHGTQYHQRSPEFFCPAVLNLTNDLRITSHYRFFGVQF